MVETNRDVQQLRRLFDVFTGARGDGHSPIYSRLSDAIPSDQELLELLLRAPPEQRRPSLLFAAVNRLLVLHPGSELAEYYPIHGGNQPVDDRLVPAFSAFCREHHEELSGLLRERSTQTNDIRRCIALRLGLDHVAQCGRGGSPWPRSAPALA